MPRISYTLHVNLPVGALSGAQPNTIPRSHRRLAELDGLRALAILPVIFNHCYPEQGWGRWTPFLGEAGRTGVDLFFVLSGYLITGILLDTVGGKHYYRNFIIRRTLRIFPLYYLCLALFTVSTKLDHSHWDAMRNWGGVSWFFAYLGNIRIAWMKAMPPVFSFVPLWSLQVEEQFYLFYPLIVLFLSRLRLRQLLIACVVIAPLLRLFLFFVTGTTVAGYVLTPCRMDSLALGGLVALLVRSPLAHKLTLIHVGICALVTGAALALCLMVSTGWESPTISSLGYSLVAIIDALLLIMIVLWPGNLLAKWLRWRPLVYTGQISYALYLLHAPSSWIARFFVERFSGIEIPGHSALSVPLTFLSAFIAADLSRRFFESPILSLKDRLTR